MTARDRLALSLVVEPGDPRLRDALRLHDPATVVRAVRRGSGPADLPLPEAWLERAHDLDRRLERCEARAAAAGLRWVCPGDRQWPAGLSDLDHVEPLQRTTGAPVGLWVRGNGRLGDLARRSVAIVGARECTTYGAECASELGADLSDNGWTVVSGAAFGIDACAHRGALMTGRPTVAVLACGADVDYPRSHATLLARIAEDGLVVSEQVPGDTPLKSRFLSRNRIIAAMTGGTVVVEAAVRSGSLNTLGWADQLGRVTMGLPGPVTSRASGGVHLAVREGKAVLVTGGRDVLEELVGLGADSEPVRRSTTEFDRLPPGARATLDGLDWQEARTVADIATGVRLSTRETRSALELLQRRALVARRGSGWVLVRRADVG